MGDIGEDIEYRLDVVVIHHALGTGAGNSRQIGQQLAARSTFLRDATGDRGVQEFVDRGDQARRCLHRDQERDAVHRIDPVVRRDLRAAAQAHEHILRDIPLIQPLRGKQGAVDIQEQRRGVEGLVDIYVLRPGMAAMRSRISCATA